VIFIIHIATTKTILTTKGDKTKTNKIFCCLYRFCQITNKTLVEDIRRESGINEQGDFEDELFYGILRRSWLELYDKTQVKVLY
jgi:hypothetical protein